MIDLVLDIVLLKLRYMTYTVKKNSIPVTIISHKYFITCMLYVILKYII